MRASPPFCVVIISITTDDTHVCGYCSDLTFFIIFAISVSVIFLVHYAGFWGVTNHWTEVDWTDWTGLTKTSEIS